MFQGKGLLVCTLLGDSLRVEFLRCLPWDIYHFLSLSITWRRTQNGTLSSLQIAKMGDASDLLKARASTQRDLGMVQARAGRTL